MRVLHVASFIGNIGDNASHRGLDHVFGQLLPAAPQVTRLEMRKFYKNYRHADARRFDAAFVDYANGFDLLVIGGGGFLDYWVPNSASGTTIDIEPELVGRLTVATLVTSVGCAPHKAVPAGNIERFRRFLDAVLANPRVRIAVRNDGSLDAIRRDIGEQYVAAIPEVLDHGFFYDTTVRPEALSEGDFVAVNITDDQIRMNARSRAAIDAERYEAELAATCRHIAQERGLPLVFVPHIHSDLFAISRLLTRLDDFTVREKISVAPCIQGDHAADRLFGVYKASRLVLATRLHANICSLAMGRPTLGLMALDRVKYVYDSLNRAENCVSLDGAFAAPLCARIDAELAVPTPSPDLSSRRAASLAIYRQWFSELGLFPKASS